MPSQIYIFEDEDRKEYISNWIRRTLDISRFDSLDNYRFELNKLLRLRDGNLSEEQINLKRYYRGETNKQYFINDTFSRIQIKIQKEHISRIRKQKRTRYTPIPNRNYSVLKELDKKEPIKQYGFIKNEKVLIRVEKTTSKKGTEYIRYRDNKGRFARLHK